MVKEVTWLLTVVVTVVKPVSTVSVWQVFVPHDSMVMVVVWISLVVVVVVSAVGEETTLEGKMELMLQKLVKTCPSVEISE